MAKKEAQPAQVWTDKKINELKKLWGKGLTTAEIGKKLNVSKNAVVGKAHRLGLKSRPSPIKNTAARKTAVAKPSKKTVEAPKKKLAPVKAAKAPVAKPAPKASAATKGKAKETPKAPVKAPAAKTKATSKKQEVDLMVDITDLKIGMCKWPIGDPRMPNFHFCGKPALDGKPYCPGHYAMAYTTKIKGK